MNMPKITMIYSVLLILLGVVGYFATGMVSITALIPTFFGIVLLILSIVANKPNMRKHCMHVAVVIALVAFLGSMSGLLQLIPLITGSEVASKPAAISRSIMAILSFIYIILGVKSFIDARRSSE